MKKILPGALIALTTLAVISVIYLSEKRNVARIPQAVIQSHLAAALPLTEVYYSSLEIRLAEPQVSVPAGGNRVNTLLQLTLRFLPPDSGEPLSGSLLISGGIRYANDTGQFYLTDPKIENLNLADMSDAQLARVNSALTMMISGFYAAQPIHALDEQDRQSMEKLLIRSVIAGNNDLIVEFGIRT